MRRAFLSTIKGLSVFADAVYDFLSTDVVDGNQAQWKNRNKTSNPSKNIIYNSAGLIPSEGSFTGSITQHALNGPNYIGDAARVTVLNRAGGETSSAFYKPMSGRTLAVGTYNFRCKIKSGVVGVTQKLCYSWNSTSTLTNIDVGDSWITINISGTVSSAAATNFIAFGSQIGMGNQTFDIAELQLYLSTDTIPDYVDDGNDGHIAKPYGIRNPIVKNGNYITNSPLALLSPSFPVPKTWTAMTALFAIRITSDTSQILFSTILDSYYGTNSTTMVLSVAGEAVFTAAVNRTGKLTNQDFVILGFGFDSAESWSRINEVLVRLNATGFSIQSQVFSIINRLPTSSPLLGDLAMFAIWDKRLTDSEWYQACSETRARLTAMSAPHHARNWYIADGDSITASFTAPQGESYAYQMATSLFDGGEYLGHYNDGTGGHNLSLVEVGLPTVLARVVEAKKGGGKAIVSLLIGRNDNGTLISNAACDAYWVRLKDYYTAIRNAGGLVIAITPLPSGTAATNGGPAGSWETYRLYLRGLMLAEPSAYDALADFGDPATVMGDVDTCENITYYAADGVHPYPAGHTLLAGIIKPIIQSLLL